MGQMTVGIMLGIEEPDDVVLRSEYDDNEPEGSGLLDRWERECAARIEAHDAKKAAKVAATGRMPYDFMSGTARFVPDTEFDNDPPLLGFWIAAGASGKNGLPHLHSLALSAGSVRTDPRYAKAYRNAKRRWARFARWARAQGVELGKPRLRLAETEVA